MIITITSSRVADEQLPQVEDFLRTFLPRMKQIPGIIAVYHDSKPKQRDQGTIVVWENEAALQAYRASDLVKEAIAFDRALGPAKHPASLPYRIGLLASVQRLITKAGTDGFVG